MSIVEELEKYAKENKIPIMQKDGILYLCNYIKNNNIKSVLEIGSAIGYSAIMMASSQNEIHITTIEKDIDRYNLAVQNIKKANLQNKITIKNMDANEYSTNNKYDLIFIDASKGNNQKFFQKFKDNLDNCGVIITDNLSFHGLVENPELIQTKRTQKLVEKIKNYITFLDTNKEFKTTYIPVGDKISISRRIIDEQNNSNPKKWETPK